MLRYVEGKLFQAITRGEDGVIGEDATHTVRMFKNVPLVLSESVDLEVRGEGVISWTNFEKINEDMDVPYTHPRWTIWQSRLCRNLFGRRLTRRSENSSIHKHIKRTGREQNTEVTEDETQTSQNAIDIHHGIEILMKLILENHSEFLIFSNVDKNLQSAYIEMRNKGLQSVFQTSLAAKIHTITFEEAYGRLKSVCGYKFSKKFDQQLCILDKTRNQIIHSEIEIDEISVLSMFDGFLSEIDKFFF